VKPLDERTLHPFAAILQNNLDLQSLQKGRSGLIKYGSRFGIGVSGKITLHLRFVHGKPR
jgi:hypothetical protein